MTAEATSATPGLAEALALQQMLEGVRSQRAELPEKVRLAAIERLTAERDLRIDAELQQRAVELSALQPVIRGLIASRHLIVTVEADFAPLKEHKAVSDVRASHHAGI